MRRRVLKNTIEPGYISNGLVFYLDCTDFNGLSIKDRIGGLILQAVNGVTIYNDGGIYFPHKVVGISNLPNLIANLNIEVPLYTGTVELCFMNTGLPKVYNLVRNSVGNIGFMCNNAYFVSFSNSREKSYKIHYRLKFTISVNNNLCIDNINNSTTYKELFLPIENSNSLEISPRKNIYESEELVLYSVRVSNRLLTKEEILYNQKVDNQKFNLGLNI